MALVTGIDVGVLEYGTMVQWLGQGGPQTATIVRVRTDCGESGVSVSWNDSPSATSMALAIAAWFREALVGIDVRHHPIAAERVMETAAWNGTSCVAIAAVDNAMWDAKAKCLGMPLHALLGTRHLSLPAYGVSREELSMTSADQVIEHVLRFKQEGHRGYKPHLWGDPRLDLDACAAIRRAVGDEFALMFDPLGRYDLFEALKVGRGLEELSYLWLEDPLPHSQRHGYPWLSRQLAIPVFATDALYWSFGDYLEAASRQCPVGLRLDAGRQGITFCRKVVEAAAPYGVRCEFHAFGPEPNSIAGLHVALSQKLESYYECCVPVADYVVPGFDAPTAIDGGGRVAAPKGPGLGLAVDWDYVDRHTNWIKE